MNVQKNLKISIFGKTYLVSTDEDDGCILQAAQLVDDLMKNKAGKMAPVGEDKIAVIVALQFATDLTKKNKELEAYQARIERLTLLLGQEDKENTGKEE